MVAMEQGQVDGWNRSGLPWGKLPANPVIKRVINTLILTLCPVLIQLTYCILLMM